MKDPLRGLVKSARRNRMHRIRALLEAGADINQRNRKGETALYVAIAYHHSEIAMELLQRGADPNIPNKHGTDPNCQSYHDESILGFLACWGHNAPIRFLVDLGLDVNAGEAPDNMTPLMWAARNGHGETVELLLGLGADPDSKILGSGQRTGHGRRTRER